MRDVADDIFLVPHDGRVLVHAPLYGITSFLNADAAAEVRAFLNGKPLEQSSDHLRPLLRLLAEREPRVPQIGSGAFAPRRVGIIPTNGCNLHCVYCAVNAGSVDGVQMPNAVCRAALRYQAEIVRCEKLDRLEVCYFGGEPFCGWDTVLFCEETGRRLADTLGVRYCSSCDTNGFMPAERAKWVAHHLAYAVVSLDGPAETHDRLRPAAGGAGTHDQIVQTLRIFKQKGLAYALRCTVDHLSVDSLEETVDYLCKQFAPEIINLEPVMCKGRCRSTSVLPPAPETFVNAVVAAGRVARQYGIDLRVGSAQVERVVRSYCDVANDQFIVTPDGLVTSCYSANHRSSPLAGRYAIGEVDADSGTIRIDPACVDRMRSRMLNHKPCCRNCFCKWHCAGGCHVHQCTDGSDGINDFCTITRKLSLWRLLLGLRLFDEADQVSQQAARYEYAWA